MLGLSSHESNHYACQEALVFIFRHLINKIKVLAALRHFNSPCMFIRKNYNYFSMMSEFLLEIRKFFIDIYDIELLLQQDKDAIISRVSYVQNHESQMRESWD